MRHSRGQICPRPLCPRLRGALCGRQILSDQPKPGNSKPGRAGGPVGGEYAKMARKERR
jgi:hypothetical protein